MRKHQLVSSFHMEFFHLENPTTLQGTPSVVEHIAPNASVTQDKNQQRPARDKARRDRLTPEQTEEMNARRRAARKNKTIEERNASQRTSRQSLTGEERQAMNAHRRFARKNNPNVQRQEVNARRRAREKFRVLNPSQCLAQMHISFESPCYVTKVFMCPIYIYLVAVSSFKYFSIEISYLPINCA